MSFINQVLGKKDCIFGGEMDQEWKEVHQTSFPALCFIVEMQKTKHKNFIEKKY